MVRRHRGIISVLRSSLLLLLALTALAQPNESSKSLREADLVELVRLDSTIRIDIRYATSNNFMKRPMYTSARAFLQRPAATALVRAHRELQKHGYGILILDGYRPWSVTKKFWDEIPTRDRAFVANPSKGSKHNRGCAVDLSLYDLKTGKEVEMPSAYDEFTERASPDYAGGLPSERKRRDLLRRVMESEGFTVNVGEWWHFDYKDWQEYGVLDVPFNDISLEKTKP